jgi:hypothetical protein
MLFQYLLLGMKTCSRMASGEPVVLFFFRYWAVPQFRAIGWNPNSRPHLVYRGQVRIETETHGNSGSLAIRLRPSTAALRLSSVSTQLGTRIIVCFGPSFIMVLLSDRLPWNRRRFCELQIPC